MKFAVPVLAALMVAAPTIAVAQESSKSAEATAEDKSQNRVICKRQEDTGSRLGSKKVCMSAAQWGQIERDQREATERTQAARYRPSGQ